ncbi:MAG: tRNA(fMet)-specific endonuclease VapC [bacterium]|nr:tRNA(fMet)-specific endonuclease VapC [bacterium]
MNVVDSSGWLEYFAEGPNAAFFASAIENTAALIVSSISIYEVFKRVNQQRDEHAALRAAALMMQGQVIPLDTPIALSAARISLMLSLPMADSVILATARATGATLWTQDEHFKDIQAVRYVAKGK